MLQSDNQWGDELEALQAEFSSEVERLEAESDVLRQQVGTLRREVGVLKDSTLVGEKQRHVDVLTKKLQSSGKLVDEMRVELEALSADKKQLAERLISYDENMDQQVSECVCVGGGSILSLYTHYCLCLLCPVSSFVLVLFVLCLLPLSCPHRITYLAISTSDCHFYFLSFIACHSLCRLSNTTITHKYQYESE